MKTTKTLLTLVICIFSFSFLFITCKESQNQEDRDSTTPPFTNNSESSVSFDYSLTAFLSGVVSPSQIGVPAQQGRTRDGTDVETLTGELSATNTSTSESENFSWSIRLDTQTLAVASNFTIILEPGNYDFSLMLSQGNQQYVGMSNFTVEEKKNKIPLTIRPVIGERIIDISVVSRLDDFKFSYPEEEFIDFTNPKIGISIDSSPEFNFTLSKGISDDYLNLSEGAHQIQLKLYDGDLQRGKSVFSQESVYVIPGVNLTMNLVPLYGEAHFVLEENGGQAIFNFIIPGEVVEEAGSLSDLDVYLTIGGPQNIPRNVLLLLETFGNDYTAEVVLDDYHYDTINFTLQFIDLLPNRDPLGSCNKIGLVLNNNAKNIDCELTLRRRAVIEGNLLAVLGVTVLDENRNPVSGASVFANDSFQGITGSDSFGTPGYLKALIKKGDYQIRAEDNTTGLFGESDITLSPLDVSNIEVTLNSSIITLPDGLVAFYPFNNNPNDKSGNENHGIANGATLTVGHNGKDNSAYHFDGVDDSIQIEDSDSLDIGYSDYSIVAWIKTGDASTNGRIFSKRGSGCAPGYMMRLYNAGILMKSGSNGSCKTELTTSTKVDDNQWHFVVGVVDREVGTKIYIDNTLAAQDFKSTEEIDFSNNRNPRIGMNDVSGKEPFHGDIDDVRIYNRVLSEEEIQILYTTKH